MNRAILHLLFVLCVCLQPLPAFAEHTNSENKEQKSTDKPENAPQSSEAKAVFETKDPAQIKNYFETKVDPARLPQIKALFGKSVDGKLSEETLKQLNELLGGDLINQENAETIAEALKEKETNVTETKSDEKKEEAKSTQAKASTEKPRIYGPVAPNYGEKPKSVENTQQPTHKKSSEQITSEVQSELNEKLGKVGVYPPSDKADIGAQKNYYTQVKQAAGTMLNEAMFGASNGVTVPSRYGANANSLLPSSTNPISEETRERAVALSKIALDAENKLNSIKKEFTDSLYTPISQTDALGLNETQRKALGIDGIASLTPPSADATDVEKIEYLKKANAAIANIQNNVGQIAGALANLSQYEQDKIKQRMQAHVSGFEAELAKKFNTFSDQDRNAFLASVPTDRKLFYAQKSREDYLNLAEQRNWARKAAEEAIPVNIAEQKVAEAQQRLTAAQQAKNEYEANKGDESMFDFWVHPGRYQRTVNENRDRLSAESRSAEEQLRGAKTVLAQSKAKTKEQWLAEAQNLSQKVNEQAVLTEKVQRQVYPQAQASVNMNAIIAHGDKPTRETLEMIQGVNVLDAGQVNKAKLQEIVQTRNTAEAQLLISQSPELQQAYKEMVEAYKTNMLSKLNDKQKEVFNQMNHLPILIKDEAGNFEIGVRSEMKPEQAVVLATQITAANLHLEAASDDVPRGAIRSNALPLAVSGDMQMAIKVGLQEAGLDSKAPNELITRSRRNDSVTATGDETKLITLAYSLTSSAVQQLAFNTVKTTIIGAGGGVIFGTAREGAMWLDHKIDGKSYEFSRENVRSAMEGGALIANAAAIAPKVVVPLLAGAGLNSAVNEFRKGNEVTAVFDGVLSAYTAYQISRPQSTALAKINETQPSKGGNSKMEGLKNHILKNTNPNERANALSAFEKAYGNTPEGKAFLAEVAGQPPATAPPVTPVQAPVPATPSVAVPANGTGNALAVVKPTVPVAATPATPITSATATAAAVQASAAVPVVMDSNVYITMKKMAGTDKSPMSPKEVEIADRIHAMQANGQQIEWQFPGGIPGESAPSLSGFNIKTTKAPNRTTPEYQSALKELEKAGVGGKDGTNDRMIVADALFNQDPKNPSPLMSSDRKVINNLWKIKTGKSPSEKNPLPAAFTVTVGDKQLQVITMSGKPLPLGQVSTPPPPVSVTAKEQSNLPANAAERAAVQTKILPKELNENPVVQKAIDASHAVGAGQTGLDGTPVRHGNYTGEMLQEKFNILKKAFDDTGIPDAVSSFFSKALIKEGVVGEPAKPTAAIEKYTDRLTHGKFDEAANLKNFSRALFDHLKEKFPNGDATPEAIQKFVDEYMPHWPDHGSAHGRAIAKGMVDAAVQLQKNGLFKNFSNEEFGALIELSSTVGLAHDAGNAFAMGEAFRKAHDLVPSKLLFGADMPSLKAEGQNYRSVVSDIVKDANNPLTALVRKVANDPEIAKKYSGDETARMETILSEMISAAGLSHGNLPGNPELGLSNLGNRVPSYLQQVQAPHPAEVGKTDISSRYQGKPDENFMAWAKTDAPKDSPVGRLKEIFSTTEGLLNYSDANRPRGETELAAAGQTQSVLSIGKDGKPKVHTVLTEPTTGEKILIEVSPRQAGSLNVKTMTVEAPDAQGNPVFQMEVINNNDALAKQTGRVIGETFAYTERAFRDTFEGKAPKFEVAFRGTAEQNPEFHAKLKTEISDNMAKVLIRNGQIPEQVLKTSGYAKDQPIPQQVRDYVENNYYKFKYIEAPPARPTSPNELVRAEAARKNPLSPQEITELAAKTGRSPEMFKGAGRVDLPADTVLFEKGDAKGDVFLITRGSINGIPEGNNGKLPFTQTGSPDSPTWYGGSSRLGGLADPGRNSKGVVGPDGVSLIVIPKETAAATFSPEAVATPPSRLVQRLQKVQENAEAKNAKLLDEAIAQSQPQQAPVKIVSVENTLAERFYKASQEVQNFQRGTFESEVTASQRLQALMQKAEEVHADYVGQINNRIRKQQVESTNSRSDISTMVDQYAKSVADESRINEIQKIRNTAQDKMDRLENEVRAREKELKDESRKLRSRLDSAYEDEIPSIKKQIAENEARLQATSAKLAPKRKEGESALEYTIRLTQTRENATDYFPTIRAPSTAQPTNHQRELNTLDGVKVSDTPTLDSILNLRGEIR